MLVLHPVTPFPWSQAQWSSLVLQAYPVFPPTSDTPNLPLIHWDRMRLVFGNRCAIESELKPLCVHTDKLWDWLYRTGPVWPVHTESHTNRFQQSTELSRAGNCRPKDLVEDKKVWKVLGRPNDLHPDLEVIAFVPVCTDVFLTIGLMRYLKFESRNHLWMSSGEAGAQSVCIGLVCHVYWQDGSRAVWIWISYSRVALFTLRSAIIRFIANSVANLPQKPRPDFSTPQSMHLVPIVFQSNLPF